MTLIRAASLTGGASVLNIISGLVRMKLAAIVFGPAGMGVIGILQSTVGTISNTAGLGLRDIGSRQIAIASAQKDVQKVEIVESALVLGSLLLAVFTCILVFIFRDHISFALIGTGEISTQLAVIVPGIAATMMVGAYVSVLAGQSKISTISKITAGTAVVSLAITAPILLLNREIAIPLFVIAAPMTNFLICAIFTNRKSIRLSIFRKLPSQWAATFWTICRLGFPVMLGAALTSFSQLSVRTLCQDMLGLESVGAITAAWQISLHYINFLIVAASYSFLPELSRRMGQGVESNRLVSEQASSLSLLSMPILLLTIGFSEYVIRIFYTSAFIDAIDLLKWIILGDIFRIASHSLTLNLLAGGHTKAYLGCKLVENSSVVLLTYLLLPKFGLAGFGIAHLLSQALTATSFGLANKFFANTRWKAKNIKQLFATLMVCSTIFAASMFNKNFGAAISLASVIVFCLYLYYQLKRTSHE